MRSFFTLLFSFIFSFGYSQKISSVDLVLSSDLTLSKVFSLNDDLEWLAENRREREKPGVGLRVGSHINAKVTKHVFFQTGVNLSTLQRKIVDDQARFPNEHDGDGGWLPTESSDVKIRIKNFYSFVEVPLIFRFQKSSKKFCPFVEAGVIPGVFYLYTNSIRIDTDRSVEHLSVADSAFNSLHAFVFLSAGFNYTSSANLQLFVQPTFRYDLRALDNSDIRENLYSVGLQMGVRRMFN